MMECKKALVETSGNLDAAAELMRKQGLAKADKKAARVAAEGVIVVERSADGHAAAMVEINCETDFVAREHDFRNFAADLARLALAGRVVDVEALLAAELAAGETVDARRRALVAKIGENISVRRSVVLETNGVLGAYAHGTRIGALVAVEGGTASLAHDLAMHVAASNPRYLAIAEVPAEVVAKEREILTEQSRQGGQEPGDRGQDGRRPAAQVAGRDRAAGAAVRQGSRADCREAAQGRGGPGAALRAIRSGRRHREEAGGLRRRSHGAGQRRDDRH